MAGPAVGESPAWRKLKSFPAERRSACTFSGMAFSPDGRQLAASISFEPLRAWELDSGRQTFEFPNPGGRLMGPEVLGWSSLGLVHFTPRPGGYTMWLQDRSLFEFQGHPYWGGSQRVLLVDSNRAKPSQRVVELPSGQTVREWHWDWQISAASLTNRVLAVTVSNARLRKPTEPALQYVQLWDVPGGQMLKQLPIRSLTLELSPDSSRLVTADGTLWSVPDGTRLLTLDRPTPAGAWEAFAFSANGNLLAGCWGAAGKQARHEVGLWSLPDGRKLQSLPTLFPATSAAFSPDGRYLALNTASGDPHWKEARARPRGELQIYTRR